MTFQNAYHGVKKVFTAQLLKVIGTVCLLISAVMGILTLSTVITGEGDGTGLVISGTGTIVFIIAGLILMLIGYIINLVGLYQAGKDDESFRSAFIFSIFALIIALVSGILQALNVAGGIADNISTTVSRVCEIIVFILLINGVTVLSEKLGKTHLIGSANTLVIFFVIIFGLGIVANLIVVFFGVNDTTATITGILDIISLVCTAIGYIIYLVFLGRAKNMLRDN